MPPLPFILLDDARPGGAPARLYQAPVEVIVAETVEAVAPALDRLRTGLARGLHAAGYLAYEAAAAFEPVLGPPPPGDGPLIWFGLFERYQAIAPEEVEAWLPDPAGAWNAAPEPLIARAAYDAAFAEVQALITAGDLYQANLSYSARVRLAGDPLALYARLRRAAAAPYAAYLDTGERQLLCCSPELFFAKDSDRLRARPMKGTARRQADPAADRAAAEALAADPKQRAENLMIVDLIRNDLSRVARAGTVAVPELFVVERYPTVHTMVSSVTAAIAPGRDAIDVLAALFPCGSITGAPKIRAMEALAAIEGAPRGPYTGAIGRIDPGGDAVFNVAIRTLSISRGAATIGLGGGIVADSRSGDEWDETLAKAAFLTAGRRRVDLIETMAFDPARGIPLLDRHLARMRASAAALGFAFDHHDARNQLQAATFRLAAPARVRLVLGISGALVIETAPMPPSPPAPVPVAIAPLPVAPSDFRLAHKTSDRGFYDAARAEAGQFEVLFTDPGGYLTEGSFTSLFMPQGDVLLTPPLARGLLPGVLRAELIDQGRAIEADLTPADLAKGFFIGNALRGLIPAVVAPGSPPRL